MGFVLRSKIRQTEKTLTDSFPEWSAQQVKHTARLVFINQGLLLAETLRRIGKPRHNPLDDIQYDPEELDQFNTIMAQGRGGLVLTAHINNYEYLSAWAARRFPMTISAKKIKPKVLGDFVEKMRRDGGITEVGHHGSYRSLLRAVKAGGVIGFIMDQNMIHREGVFVTFFGRPACTTAGLAMLSAQSGTPVVPVFLLREGSHYRIRMLPPIPPPPDRNIETLQVATQLYSNAIEKVIREQPESWIWMHRRWKTPPVAGDRITLPDGTVYYHE
jgi:Kdo2-lipid IVA lauroyltransferase/acyltransferase